MNKIKQILFLISIIYFLTSPRDTLSQQGWATLAPFTSKNLYSIGQTGVYTTYLCSDSGTIYKYVNNGNNWVVSSQDPAAIGLSVRYLAGSSNDNWMTVGDSTLFMYKSGTTVYTTRIVTSPNQTKPNLDAYLFLSGYFFYQAHIAAGDSGLVYRSVGNGWRRDTLAIRLAAGRKINSGRADILVGNGGLIMFADSIGLPGGDGVKWKVVPSGTTQNLMGVFGSGVVYMAVGTGGVILRSSNSGLNWVSLPSPTTENLLSGWLGYASLICGANGVILKSTSSGQDNWFRQTTATANDLYCIFPLGYQEYVSAGENGVILSTTNGGGPPMGISQISDEVPENFSLGQNYPNPFNPTTNIEFSIPKAGYVRLIVYDITGKSAAVLVNEELRAGTYKSDFDASGLSSGVYIYRIEANGFTYAKKMLIIK